MRLTFTKTNAMELLQRLPTKAGGMGGQGSPIKKTQNMRPTFTKTNVMELLQRLPTEAGAWGDKVPP